MTIAFKRGMAQVTSTTGRSAHVQEFASIAAASEPERQRLCEELLGEFGAEVEKITSKGEMIHSCILPFGQHPNGDRNPSASLNYKKLTFKCLGCLNSGGLLWFIAVCRGCTVEEAKQWLGKQTKGGGARESLSDLLSFLDAIHAAVGRPEPLPRLSDRLLAPWRLIHPYLTEWRGIDEANIKALQVGYNPTEDRIVIPHFWEGHLVGWQTRRLGGTGPKYLSTPGFPKDETIYHYQGRDTAVVVESPMTVLTHLDTEPRMEATFGAAVTDQQVRLLGRHDRVILWFDNDKGETRSGWTATEQVGERLERMTKVYVVQNPFWGDPADLIAPVVRTLIEEAAIPFAIWTRPSPFQLEDAPMSIRKTGAGQNLGVDADTRDPEDIPEEESTPEEIIEEEPAPAEAE